MISMFKLNQPCMISYDCFISLFFRDVKFERSHLVTYDSNGLNIILWGYNIMCSSANVVNGGVANGVVVNGVVVNGCAA